MVADDQDSSAILEIQTAEGGTCAYGLPMSLVLSACQVRVIHPVLGPRLELHLALRQPYRVSPLWDMLFPREGKPPSVPP